MKTSFFKKKLKQKISKYNYLDIFFRKIWVFFSKFNYYIKYHGISIEKDLILFECFKGKYINDSPLAIYNKLLELNSNHKYIWVVSSFDDIPEHMKNRKNTSFAVYGSEEYLKAYASASFFIVNCRTPLCIVKKKGQVLVQCWHGTPLKKMAYDIAIGNNVNTSLSGLKYSYDVEVSKVDYFLSPSPYATQCFCSSFNMPKSLVLEVGYPRNDYLINNQCNIELIDSLKNRLGISVDKRVVLYAPTWRDNQYNKSKGKHVLINPLDDVSFVNQFTDTVFLYRGHYFTQLLSHSVNFIDVSSVDDINELFLISDILITDYSSLFFDFMNLSKKVVFFMPDLNEYMNETRGFYLDVERQLPGRICYDLTQLSDAINDSPVDLSIVCQFNKLYNPYEDGNSSLRVLKKLELLSNG